MRRPVLPLDSFRTSEMPAIDFSLYASTIEFMIRSVVTWNGISEMMIWNLPFVSTISALPRTGIVPRPVL